MYLNSTGAYWGTVENPSSNTWQLAYENVQDGTLIHGGLCLKWAVGGYLYSRNNTLDDGSGNIVAAGSVAALGVVEVYRSSSGTSYLDLYQGGIREWKIGMLTAGSDTISFQASGVSTSTLDSLGDLTLAGGLTVAGQTVFQYTGNGANSFQVYGGASFDSNVNFAGQLNFWPSSGKYAYLIWSNSYVLTLGANGGPFYYGIGHDGYTGYFGALDCGAVFTQYINPIGSLNTVTLGGNFTVNGNIYSWNGGGGGGSNGGIYLDSYGNVRFGGGSGTGDHNWVTYFDNTILMQVWNNGYLSLPQTLNGSNVPVYCNSSGTLYKSSSSIRYKERIQPVTDSSWIYNLKPVTFYWKQEEQALRGVNQQIGLIAEDVNALQPLLTYIDAQGNIDGVYYEKLAVPIVVELQKLRARVDQLESQLKQNSVAAA